MKEIKFKYFLNGIETKKEDIDWNRSASVRGKGNEIHVKYMSYLTDKADCGMSTRHKACGQGYPVPRQAKDLLQNLLIGSEDFSNAIWGKQEDIRVQTTPYIRTSSADELLREQFKKDADALQKSYNNSIPRLDYDAINKEFSSEGVKESEGKLDYELDWNFLTQLAERMSKNKDKYPPYNWKKPMDVEKLKQATFRHMLEIMNGNYEDDGRLQGHLEALALNAMMINYQLKNKK